MPSFLLSAQKCDPESQLAYYKEVLVDAKASSVEVQLDVDGKGKGVVATRDISEGDTVFIERPLVILQHLDNHGRAFACQACLRFVGSVERQIGHKLRSLVKELRGVQQGATNANCDESDEGEVDLDEALEAGERLEQIYSHVTPERISELCSGAVTLPLSDDFPMPQPVPCRRGCGAVYCGTACEEGAWQHSHCLLCTRTAAAAAAQPFEDVAAPGPSSSSPSADLAGTSGERPSEAEKAASSAAAAAAAAAAGPTAAAEPSSSSTEAMIGGTSDVEELYGIRIDRRALAAFWEHARETNEIFLLAAQVVAATLLKAAKFLAVEWPKAAQAEASEPGRQQQPEVAEVSEAGPSSSLAQPPASGPSASGSGACQSALLAAWRPYMYGWKRVWWEAVAVPEDVDDEEDFRAQLRSLASDSLELLSAAISDPRFCPDLMQLGVYGSIVGMFELNNMGLVVSSPVEDFFLAVDEMDEGAEKLAVTQATQPLLDALDAEYASPCEATAFLALQSCINHSCDPNCTAACDSADRTVTVLAQRDVAAGEEITLSYIDVSLPYKERQAELRDYGFVCRCARCTADAAAARAKRQGGSAAGKGLRVGRRR